MTEEKPTPKLEDVIEQGATSVLVQARTILIAKVISFDASTSSCSVKPCINQRFEDGSEQEYPVLEGLPVVFPSFGAFTITSELKKGQEVVVMCSERSLDEWLLTGNSPVTASDPRRFSLQDGIVMAGIRPYGDPFEVSEDLVIGDGNVNLTLTSGGKIKLGNQGGDVLGILDALITQVAALTVSSFGAPPNNAAAISALKTQLALIKG